MSAERFTLDANILVYAVDERDTAKHEAAIAIVEAAIRLDCPLALQAIAEFYVVSTGKLRLGARDAAARARQLMTSFEIFSHSPGTVRTAMDEAAAGRFSFWDSMLLASAAEAGCTLVLSEDMKDGARFGAITIVNPFASGRLSVRVRELLAL